MQTENATICPKCFNKINDNHFCSICGNDITLQNSESCLKTFTFLKEKYIIGKVIRQNGEHIIYIGYDVTTKQKIYIKEYMPSLICERQDDGTVIAVPGNEAQYKSLLSDFYDLNQRLQKSESDIVFPIVDIVGENNTVYVIASHEDYISLHEYIKQNGGELNWEQTKRLFFPFILSLEKLHKKNILHRGISPQTIILTKSGKLLLLDFSLASTRTLKSEVDAELFEGYSAPEQYSLKSWQGTWTDVYSLAAVLYRCLTGTRPLHSLERFKKDFMLQADHLNPNIPDYISEAISKAMIVKSDQRYQSLGVFLLYLQGDVAKDKSKHKKANPLWQKFNTYFYPKILFTSMAITVAVLCAVGYFLFTSIFKNEIDSFFKQNHTQTSSIEAVDGVTPNLVGATLESVQFNNQLQKKFVFVQELEYNEDYAYGVIFEQSPDANTTIEDGATITIKVSKGSEYVQIPNIEGKSVDEAINMIIAAGIPDYSVEEVDRNIYVEETYEEYDQDGNVIAVITQIVAKDPIEPGIVFSVFPGVGEKVSIRTGSVYITAQTKNPTPPTVPTTPESPLPPEATASGEPYEEETSSEFQSSTDDTSSY